MYRQGQCKISINMIIESDNNREIHAANIKETERSIERIRGGQREREGERMRTKKYTVRREE